jgi:acetylornithine deacetylase
VPSLTAVEARALDAVDTDTIVTDLLELLAVPSVGGAVAESDIQQLLAARLDGLGMDVDLWSMDLPALTAAPRFPGVEVDRAEAWGLVGTRSGAGDRPALVLQGHVDVVPAGDRAQWRSDPFAPSVVGSRVHGRGACDMKAGVVANLAAMSAILRSGRAAEGRRPAPRRRRGGRRPGRVRHARPRAHR